MNDTDVFSSQDHKGQHVYADSKIFSRKFLERNDPLVTRLIDFRLSLLTTGWPVIPVGGKSHLPNGWTSGEMTEDRVRAETLAHLSKLNTGIRTGYIVGVDNDLTDPDHAAGVDEIVELMIGPTPLKRRGSKGAMLVYRNETPIKKLTMTSKDGVRLFEILGHGQQFVAFGLHPKGMHYTWDGDDPFEFPATELPEVTPESLQACYDTVKILLTELGYEFASDKTRVQVSNASVAPARIEDRDEDIPELCREALAAIPNDINNREEWVEICYAIRDAGLSYGDWCDWCARWTGGTNSEYQMRVAWNSCNPRAITFRTLLWKADQIEPYWRTRYRFKKTERRNQQWAADMRDWLK